MATDFDYIVVGAGSAGCVLAARLSENADCTVLLLESGPPDTMPEISIPPAWPALWGTAVDYSYSTVPQPGTAGSAHNWPRGNTLGGSSSINAMVYLRGHRADFDRWSAAGCAGWDYESVLPYFQRMESVTGKDPKYRGSDGPMRPETAVEPNPLSQVFLDAASASGYARTDDFNGAEQEGAGWHDLSITGGHRQSTAAAYLHPHASGRKNLTVSTDSRARRLIFDGARCVGVEFLRGEQLVTARAQREVLLSAGAVDSPRLLMLSGIGPADELRAAGVEALHDLPGVGRNLHDHPLLGVVYEASKEIPPGRNNHAEVSMLWRSGRELSSPDMQLMFIHVPFHPPTLHAPANSATFGIAAAPDSRGSIRLADADPDTAPLIDPNYLGCDSDINRLVDGIGVARELASSAPFRTWLAREILPGSGVTDKAGLRDFVARGTGTYYHPVGTCAMGTGEDAVVAPNLQVHGLEGLRVVDASVMPSIVCVNTNAATIMIAEKAVDLISH